MAPRDRHMGRCALPLLLLVLMAGTSPSEDAREGTAESPATLEAGDTSAEARAPEFELRDQFGATHRYTYPREKVAVLLIADKQGSEQVSTWVLPLYERYKDRIDIDGVADLSAVPGFLRGTVRFFIKRSADHPIMLDWDGAVCGDFACVSEKVNVFLVNKDGSIRLTLHGPADDSLLERICAEIDLLQSERPGTRITDSRKNG
ncbi:MAG: hypothetical protein IT364_21610 [Candidatus Hydrogenedentes bacterium]|nr:hypothetical protein [Candidatus Hydrogenedentota bacterium]